MKSEIETLFPQRSATTSGTAVTEKLSKKERDAIDAAFQGKWTWKDGGIAVANHTVYSGNDRWTYEIKTDGTIQIFSKPNSKLALLTLKPDRTTYTATDVTGASWEGKHQ